MTKPQVIWLIIRLAGVYFAFLAVTTFIGFVGSIPAIFTLPKIDAPSKNANVSPVNPNSPIVPSMTPRPYPPGFNPADPNSTPNFATPGENPAAPNAKPDESIADKFKGENFKNFLYFFFLTAIYAAATWYLLRDGRVLYAVLSREEPLGLKASKEPEVTSLNLGDEAKD